MGDCVIAMRKSLTARFMMKKLGGVRSFLLLKHKKIEKFDISTVVIVDIHYYAQHVFIHGLHNQQKQWKLKSYIFITLHC